MMIVGLHHVAVSVPDLDAALAFYVDTLGFTVDFGGEWDDKPQNDRVIGLDGTAAKVVMLRAGSAFVELWEYRRPQPAPRDPTYSPADHGIAHFCIQVTDIVSEHARLQAAGMTFHGPPVELGRGSAIYGRDPFGNIVELYEIYPQP
jgi:glyoxylase I family protein